MPTRRSLGRARHLNLATSARTNRLSYTPSVPSQRAKNKKVISVAMEDGLIAAIERFAASKGWDRTKAIKYMCRKVLGLKMPED